MIDSAEHPSLKGDDHHLSYNSQAYPWHVVSIIAGVDVDGVLQETTQGQPLRTLEMIEGFEGQWQSKSEESRVPEA